MLHPWWQAQQSVELCDKSEFRDVDRFASIKNNWRNFFQYVDDLMRADWVVLPCDWKYYVKEHRTNTAYEFLVSMAAKGKRTMVQYYSDDATPLNLSDIHPSPVVMRTSLFASKRRPYEHTMPGFIGEPMRIYGPKGSITREKQGKPTVGFCGQTSPSLIADDELERLLLSHDISDAQIYTCRSAVLDYIQRSPRLNSDVIRRHGYCAGISHANDTSALRRVRQEYYANMFGSDYMLCMRGKGNYSYRFYETLACARIPILVDTDSPLPFSDSIRWLDHCVFIQARDVKHIGDIVADHYASLSDDRFRAMQLRNHALWQTMLTPEMYFSRMFRKLSHEEWT
ncbi:exostosin family protein [Accumulibacter sp.]|uniref:exostosin domain-containing protein n=1 Tax=Accumulibacter sp. TaxID=2053492 RepID=UPI00262ED7A5|nr:exostosin family protein [Accumulibacter sp.]